MVDLGSLPGARARKARALTTPATLVGMGSMPMAGRCRFFGPRRAASKLARKHGDSRNYSFGINDRDELTGQQYGSGNSGEIVHAFFWAPIDG
jgi:hypothetical protein